MTRWTQKEAMQEAEVILRLAFFILETMNPMRGTVEVSIDGMHNKVFKVRTFLESSGWKHEGHDRRTTTNFVGTWRKGKQALIVFSVSGQEDLRCELPSGEKFIAEAKKGSHKKQVDQTVYGAVGQIVCSESFAKADRRVIAIPDGLAVKSICKKVSRLPQIKSLGITFAAVSRDGVRWVNGMQ